GLRITELAHAVSPAHALIPARSCSPARSLPGRAHLFPARGAPAPVPPGPSPFAAPPSLVAPPSPLGWVRGDQCSPVGARARQLAHVSHSMVSGNLYA